MICKIDSLGPNSFEASKFKLKVKESCYGYIIKGLVMYKDSASGQNTVPIEPFEIP